jgi:hypothetical protein
MRLLERHHHGRRVVMPSHNMCAASSHLCDMSFETCILCPNQSLGHRTSRPDVGLRPVNASVARLSKLEQVSMFQPHPTGQGHTTLIPPAHELGQMFGNHTEACTRFVKSSHRSKSNTQKACENKSSPPPWCRRAPKGTACDGGSTTNAPWLHAFSIHKPCIIQYHTHT